MSKKLEELILAAGTTGKRQVWFTRAEVENIASLVTSECISQCEKNVDHPYLGAGSKLSAFNIKEHFGILDA
jgi:hypothetical protein